METAPCIIKNNDTTVVWYVRNLVVMARTEENIHQLKDKLESNLVLKDLGKLKSFLDIRFTCSNNSVYLI